MPCIDPAPAASSSVRIISVVCIGLCIVACGPASGGSPDGGADGSSPDGGADGGASFHSDEPLGPWTLQGVGADAGGSVAAAVQEPTDNTWEDPPSDLLEAQGDTLFVLSERGGLSTVDVSRPDAPGRSGHAPRKAHDYGFVARWAPDTPIGLHTRPAGAVAVHARGEVRLFELSSEGAPVLVATLPVEGSLTASWQDGDVLTVVGHGPADDGATTVTRVHTFDVAELATAAPIQQYTVPTDEPEGIQRALEVHRGQGRLYFVVPNVEGAATATIQIVDVDAAGAITSGAQLSVEGDVRYGWQLDEDSGSLRVLGLAPTVLEAESLIAQTFSVISSTDIAAIGRTEVALAEGAALRSAHFDGERVYLLSADRNAPLRVVELPELSAPMLLGDVSFGAELLHVQPRGARLLSLSKDGVDTAAPITLALHDVSDVSSPTELSRVELLGDWRRAHRRIRLLSDEGLILVPYGAWDEEDGACGAPRGGVQIVDLTDDALAARGSAEHDGIIGRPFLHEDQLLSVSEETLYGFDVGDRDAPRVAARLPLARRLSQTVMAGDSIVRLGQTWSGRHQRTLDVTSRTGATSAVAPDAIDLPTTLANPLLCNSSRWNDVLGANGTTAFVVQANGVATFDTSAPSGPMLMDSAETPPHITRRHPSDGAQWVQVGTTLVIASPGEAGERSVAIVDMSNPADVAVNTLALEPSPVERMTFSTLHTDGRSAYASYYTQEASGRVQFFVERIDVAEPASPRVVTFAAPGELLSVDSGTGRLLTLEYERVVAPGASDAIACAAALGEAAQFSPERRGQCLLVHRTLHLADVVVDGVASVLSSLPVPDDLRFEMAAQGDGRYFLLARRLAGVPELFVVHGFDGLLAMDSAPTGVGAEVFRDVGWTHLLAAGDKVLLLPGPGLGLRVIDTSDPSSPRRSHTVPLHGWAEHVALAGTDALVSLSFDGVQRIDLASVL